MRQGLPVPLPPKSSITADIHNRRERTPYLGVKVGQGKPTLRSFYRNAQLLAAAPIARIYH